MSPAVWDDAIPRVLAAAATLGLHVEMPNEEVGERPRGSNFQPSPWLDIEVDAESAGSIEIGGAIWDEHGSIFLHVMIPIGTGMRDGLVMRKALSVAFRGITDATEGLIYRNDQSFDPLGPAGDDGVYRRLTLIVRYHYQDRSS